MEKKKTRVDLRVCLCPAFVLLRLVKTKHGKCKKTPRFFFRGGHLTKGILDLRNYKDFGPKKRKKKNADCFFWISRVLFILLDSSLCSTSRRAHFTPQDVPNFPSSSCSTCRPSAPLPPVPRIHAMLPRLARLRHCPPFDPNSINKFSPRFAVSRQLPPILQPTLPISPETPNSPRNSPTRRITFSKPHGHNLAGDERPHVRVLYKGN